MGARAVSTSRCGPRSSRRTRATRRTSSCPSRTTSAGTTSAGTTPSSARRRSTAPLGGRRAHAPLHVHVLLALAREPALRAAAAAREPEQPGERDRLARGRGRAHDAAARAAPRRGAARYYCVAIGKWHLGARTPAALPRARGFDEHLGYLKGGVRHFTQRSHDGGVGSPRDADRLVDLWRDDAPARGESGEYGAWLFAREAERVIGARLGGAGAGGGGGGPPPPPTPTTRRGRSSCISRGRTRTCRPRCPRCTSTPRSATASGARSRR